MYFKLIHREDVFHPLYNQVEKCDEVMNVNISYKMQMNSTISNAIGIQIFFSLFWSTKSTDQKEGRSLNTSNPSFNKRKSQDQSIIKVHQTEMANHSKKKWAPPVILPHGRF